MVKQIIFIGSLPPPITGMTAMNNVIVQALQQSGPLRCINWSRNKPLKGLRWKMARMWGACKSVVGLLASGYRHDEILYYPANSRGGLYYDILIIALARLLGYRLVLHHHAYSYIDNFDRRMAWVNRLVGKSGRHVVHCEKMRNDFLTRYSTEAHFLFVPPTIVSQQLLPSTTSKHEAFTLGCLSNLTFAKGLRQTIATFEQLARAGQDVRLVLAGPCMGREERQLVQKTIDLWPSQAEYLGPTYGEAKSQFYADIDAFLFPSENESWGIVLNEAMSVGCPVIANDRGCVAHILQEGCGFMVPRDAEFVSEATRLIQQWIDDSKLYEQACQQALMRNEQLEREADELLPRFVGEMRELSR